MTAIFHTLPSIKQKTKSRVGRGIAAGRGKTAGRGTKGQKSRSGYNLPRRFEGGQMALTQRLPKVRGFKHHAIKPSVINLKTIIARYKDNEVVSPETLIAKGIVSSNSKAGIKIVGKAEITKKLTFTDVQFSKTLAETLAKTPPQSSPSSKKPTLKK